MCQVWCSSIQGIYAQLQGGNLIYAGLLGVSICHGYMCIVLYIELIWCNGFAEIYDLLEGVNCHGYMCIVLYMKLIWCIGFAEIYAELEAVNCHRYMCIVLYIYIDRSAKFGVAVFKASMC